MESLSIMKIANIIAAIRKMNMTKNKLPTIEILRENQQALQEKFGSNESIAYSNVSKTQLSVARYYGGIKVNGQDYTYNPADDSLIRNDVVKFIMKLIKQNKKEKHDQEQIVADFL
jgi:hypothetical protein